jgi:hypothetical protein
MGAAMRVLYVLDRFPVLSETFVVDELRGLLRAGDDVSVYAREAGGEAGVADDLRELVVGPGMRAPVRGLGAALRLRERGALHALAQATWLANAVRADHVHAHFAFGAASRRAAGASARAALAAAPASAAARWARLGDGIRTRPKLTSRPSGVIVTPLTWLRPVATGLTSRITR